MLSFYKLGPRIIKEDLRIRGKEDTANLVVASGREEKNFLVG